MRLIRRRLYSLCVVLLAVPLVLIGLPSVVPAPTLSDDDIRMLLPDGYVPDLQNGSALYHMGGCGNCHTDAPITGIIGGLPSGGVPLISFAGEFIPPNITPDDESGIGMWSDADFVNAMKFGVSPQGDHYYPAFPYTAFAGMQIKEMLDLKAYLDSLDPVSTEDRRHKLSFPFSIRPAVYYWKLMFHDPEEFVPDPSRSDEWNRGAYLVEAVGHCGFCHTPRNLFWAESGAEAFAGAEPLKDGEGGAPALAGIDALKIVNGLDEWSGSIDESSSMFLVTQSFAAHASYEDVDAIAAYLSSLPTAE